METPKPRPPLVILTADKLDSVPDSIRPSQWIVDAMKEQLDEVKKDFPKPKAQPKPKVVYIAKNQPLKDHPGLMALKNDLEKR